MSDILGVSGVSRIGNGNDPVVVPPVRPRPGDPAVTPELVSEHGLAPDEYAKVVDLMGREPTYTELGVFSVMWSEHCSYKTSRIHLANLPTEGPEVLQGPGENAGVVDIGDGWAVCFKMESHNHPSFIEPYQGAATGVGGILRDVFTMGARPIALLNSLRFGRADHPKTPHLVDGVVAGIAGYGNCIGVPTVAGEVAFHPCYDGNILVNAMAFGVMRGDAIFRGVAAGPGNPVLYVGARTGRDGIHGATMASDVFEEGKEGNRPTVQVGDPYKEKLLLEACLELMKRDAIVAIQDMGAAGLTSSSVEMAGRGGTGLRLDVDAVPRREEGMTPYECLLSESQERMLLVAAKGREHVVAEVFAKWDLEAVVIGEVTDDGLWRIEEGGEIVAAIPVEALADAPKYDRPRREPADLAARQAVPELPGTGDCGDVLLRLLASPGIADKRWVYRQYDHMVRLNTLVRPGAADAAVLRIPETDKACALTVDCNQVHVKADPFEGAAGVVAEAARNVACTGARPLAATDCLNFGNPERPEVMWEFERAVSGLAHGLRELSVPVISGNVSLYNETSGTSIHPTPTLGMVGLLDDASHAVTMALRRGDGLALLLLGNPRQTLGATAYASEIHGVEQGAPPRVHWDEERALLALLQEGAKRGWIQAAHDAADGGLAVALAEMALAGTLTGDGSPIGCTVQLPMYPDAAARDLYLFGETHGCAWAMCSAARVPDLFSLAQELGCRALEAGTVGGDRIVVLDAWKQPALDVDVIDALAAWRGGFETAVGVA